MSPPCSPNGAERMPEQRRPVPRQRPPPPAARGPLLGLGSRAVRVGPPPPPAPWARAPWAAMRPEAGQVCGGAGALSGVEGAVDVCLEDPHVTHLGVLGSLNPRAPVAPEPQAAVFTGPSVRVLPDCAQLPAAQRLFGASHHGTTGPLLPASLARPGSLCLSSPHRWAQQPRTPSLAGPSLGLPACAGEGRQCYTVRLPWWAGVWPQAVPARVVQCGPELPGRARTRMSPGCKRPDSLTWAEPPSPRRPGEASSLLDEALPGPPASPAESHLVVPADTRSLNDF